MAFGWAAGVHLPAWIPILLALAAWAVYIADRLLDARAGFRSGNLNALRERHRFHWRHRRIFVPLALLAAAAAACIVLALMPSVARKRDSILGAAALTYFAGVHFKRSLAPAFLAPLFSKELLVGVLFTSACALPTLGRALPRAFWPIAVAALYFTLLAWLNCHLIERWESAAAAPISPQPVGSEGKPAQLIRPFNTGAPCPILAPFFWRKGGKPQHDLRAGSESEGKCTTLPAPIPLALLGLILSVVLVPVQPRAATLVVAASASSLLLALLDRHRARFTPLALRAAADLVLLTPIVVLLQ